MDEDELDADAGASEDSLPDEDPDRLELDGSAGGGQLLRTALTLSIATDRAVEVTNVRGARPNPGLRPQHLAAVRAAAAVCDAAVEGAEEGSSKVVFRPGSLSGGRVSVDVGTAGSLTLLFDALVPLSLRLDRSLAVTATGGTDVKWSPTMAYYRQVKLPLLREAGVFAAVDCHRTGFYPAGGGEATLWLAPGSPTPTASDAPTPLELTERGSLEGVRIYSKASADLAERDVAERQAASAAERLRVADARASAPTAASEDVPVRERTHSTVETTSTGSAVAVALDFEETVAGFDALGAQGKPAEEVGWEVAESALEFLDGPGAVDAHLADQLVVLLALAGGRVAIPAVTDHVRTCVDLVAEFGFPVAIRPGDPPVLSAER